MDEKNRASEGEEIRAFGHYLRDLRRGKKLNQTELAEKLDLSAGYYGFFEQGRSVPSPKIIKQLASVLDADYLELMRMAGHLDDNLGHTAASDKETQVPNEESHSQSPTPQRGSSPEINTRMGASLASPPLLVRLDWAVACVASDPTYIQSPSFRDPNLPVPQKLLIVRLYQAETKRHLLTVDEVEALNQLLV